MKLAQAFALWALSCSAALADEAQDAFVESNLLSIFYHELGHAVIDVARVPIFGQEEDAADVMSILMIDALFKEQPAQDIAYDAAFGFQAGADDAYEPAYWDVHGPDLQRYYTLVCLFYGANPDAREDLAIELGLPEERAIGCEDEFSLANDSWGPIWDDLEAKAPGKSLRFVEPKGKLAESLSAEVLRYEVDALNATFALPRIVDVRIESCGQANAFYDPNDRTITLCAEFEPYLRDLYRN